MDNKALYKLTYGLFLLTAHEDEKDNGCIINTAIQVASEPTRILISVQQSNHTHDMILRTGAFNVSSITTKADFELFKRFGMQSGRDTDKFDGFTSVNRSGNGIYYLTKSSNAFFSVKVTKHVDLGSHTLFIGELTEAQVLSGEESCTYGFYQSDIKLKPVATASSDKDTAHESGKNATRTWTCSVCGYVYAGDEIPDGYKCPLCNHGKEYFV